MGLGPPGFWRRTRGLRLTVAERRVRCPAPFFQCPPEKRGGPPAAVLLLSSAPGRTMPRAPGLPRQKETTWCES